MKLQITEAVTKGVLLIKVFLEISKNSQESTCARVSFLIKLQAWGSGTGVLLWILRNFSENLFYKTPPDDWFQIYNTKTKAYVPIWARSLTYQKGQSWWNLNRFQKQSFADNLQNRCSCKLSQIPPENTCAGDTS